MNRNNGNGSRPKVDPQLGEEVRLRLVKDSPFVGRSDFGPYFLYTVLDLSDHTEKAFFAPEDIHSLLVEKNLGVGSEFLVKKVAAQNGKKIGSKLEIAFIGNGKTNGPSTAPPQNGKNGSAHSNGNGIGYKSTMLECLVDAFSISKDPQLKDLPFRTEDVRSIALTLFIARSKVQEC